jgi:hypothetical protein
MSNSTHTEPAPTLEEVWRLFRETDRRLEEQARETDRYLKEMALEAERRALERAQEADRRAQESKREWDEIKQALKDMSRKVGELGNRLGEFVEELIKPSIVRLFQERGIDVHVVTRDVEANNPALGLAMQIDLLVVNNDSCVLIEVKSKLSQEDVDEHLERMGKFKPLFPKYADCKVYGAVAGMVIPENIAKYAYRQGLFVIAQQGDLAVILNDQKFLPKAW